MHQRRKADSDHDWCIGINRQKANTWSFFNLRKITSCRLFVGERKHIIWDTKETQIPKSCRAENTERKEKASPLNEFALRGLVVLLKWNTVVGSLPILPYWALLTVISTRDFAATGGRSISVLSEQYETPYLFYVTLSFLCNRIYYPCLCDPFRGHNKYPKPETCLRGKK